METKKCGKCFKTKPLSEYAKDDLFLRTGNHDGLTYYCIPCLEKTLEHLERIKKYDANILLQMQEM